MEIQDITLGRTHREHDIENLSADKALRLTKTVLGGQHIYKPSEVISTAQHNVLLEHIEELGDRVEAMKDYKGKVRDQKQEIFELIEDKRDLQSRLGEYKGKARAATAVLVFVLVLIVVSLVV